MAGLKGAKNVSARMPEGGMFVMVDVRKTGLTGEDFARRLLAEEAVVTMPGESFGAGGAGHLRVALTVDEDQISEACKRICGWPARFHSHPGERRDPDFHKIQCPGTRPRLSPG